jgi:hypothetical protein
MAKTKMKDFSVSVNPEEVMYTSINTSKDGYNSARMVIKKGDSEYMSISYEWEGNNIPGFAMDLMGFMKQNNIESSGVWSDKEEAYAEYAAKKGVNPFTKKKDEKDMEDEEEDPKKKKTDKKEDKKKK